MRKTHNPLHSLYGEERGYQPQSNSSNYRENDPEQTQFVAELEDTSGNQDVKGGKAKRQWVKVKGMATARMKATSKPRTVGPAVTPDYPAPLRINKPVNIAELSANETLHHSQHSRGSAAPQSASPSHPPGPEYIYDKSAGGLIRNPYARDLNSFGSTTANADTSVVSDDDASEGEEPQMMISRRALSSVPITATDTKATRAEGAAPDSDLALTNIVLLKACLKYPEFKGLEEEPPQNAFAKILEKYGSMRGQLDPSGPSRKDLLKAQNELRAVRTELLNRNDEVSRHGDETDALNGQIANLKHKVRELEMSYDTRSRSELRALQAENERIKSMYEHQIRKEREEVSRLYRRQQDDERTINDLNARLVKDATLWSQTCDDLKADNAALEDELHEAREEKNKLAEKWDRKLQKERIKYEGYLEEVEVEKQKLQMALDKEKAHKQAELQDQKEQLEERYRGEKEQLRTEIEEFKVAVTQREHFKGLTDSEVANQYKRLANSIEDFARVEWSFAKEADWPLSDSKMRQLGKNPRKMKHQIIQNTLWMLLYKHVFCSPFRILGTAGEEFDEGWAQIYSHGASSFEWPEVSADVERSRFENAKAYLNAVGSSANGSSMNDSFERSVNAVVNSIIRALERVTMLHADNRGSLETMVHLAAKIWLESCSQRYRLIVVLSNGSGDILSSTGTVDMPLRLIIRPDLKRYGDSQGKHLTRGEPVAGWKSLTETYS